MKPTTKNIAALLAISALVMTALAAGCTIARVGPKNLDALAVATSPGGSQVELQLGTGKVKGELLEVTLEHVMIETSGAIVIAPYESLRELAPARLPATRTYNRVPSDSVIAQWLPLARFPAGIHPDHLAALLAAHGQTEPTVVR